jgi:hypothetical protein
MITLLLRLGSGCADGGMQARGACENAVEGRTGAVSGAVPGADGPAVAGSGSVGAETDAQGEQHFVSGTLHAGRTLRGPLCPNRSLLTLLKARVEVFAETLHTLTRSCPLIFGSCLS